MSGSDLSGRQFGLLAVRKEKHKAPDVWVCLCQCGRVVHLFTSQLTRDVVKDCGCREGRPGRAAQRHIRFYVGKDGKRHQKASAEHASYASMLNRCLRESTAGWDCYGARGIRVCSRWREPRGLGFRNFLEDMGPRPDGMTLDRKDPNSHYTPDNCRWATPEVQAANKRDGDEPPVRDIAEAEEMMAAGA
jgi:hypothetical protein